MAADSVVLTGFSMFLKGVIEVAIGALLLMAIGYDVLLRDPAY